MRRRSNLLFYLLLNIFVSAATTLVVLWVWNNAHQSPAAEQQEPPQPQVMAQNTAAVAVQNTLVPAAATLPLPALPVETAGPTETLPPAGQQLIQIDSVVGAGDLEQEVVTLKHTGAGNLSMAGWKLEGQHKNTYTFPKQPELILYKDGAVQVYSKPGTDTVFEVYWNRAAAAWSSGELIRLLDPQGTERATYRIP